MDMNSYPVYKIQNPENEKEVICNCEQWVWSGVTWKDQYEAFLTSLPYAKYLKNQNIYML
jgi:hypothetical protein